MNLCLKKTNSGFSESKSRKKINKNKFLGVLMMSLLILFFAGCDRKTETKESKNKANMETMHLNKSGFEKLFVKDDSSNYGLTYKGDSPAIIDFYASWCGPCKMLSPVLEKLAGEYKGRVNVYKVDVDMERELASELRIMSIPTLLVVKPDGEMKVLQGAMSETELKKIIDGFLLQ